MTSKLYTSDTVLISLLIILLGAAGYLGWQYYEHTTTIATLKAETAAYETELTASEADLADASNTILALQEDLELLEEEIEELEEDYRDERDKNEEFEDQLRDLGKVVGDLDKLSRTDEELLQKYSKAYFLNENYVPSNLEEIDDRYVLDDREPEFFHGNAMDFLEELMEEAKDDDIDLEIVSAYRSFDEQNELKGQFTQVYGSGANAFSADQGFSEHQLGTTVDFVSEGLTSASPAFADTEAYEWLLDHAHRYGFVLSYPEENTFYIFEPWHWRFVGTDLARDLHRDDAYFYDWDQRKIDEYLINVFD